MSYICKHTLTHNTHTHTQIHKHTYIYVHIMRRHTHTHTHHTTPHHQSAGVDCIVCGGSTFWGTKLGMMAGNTEEISQTHNKLVGTPFVRDTKSFRLVWAGGGGGVVSVNERGVLSVSGWTSNGRKIAYSLASPQVCASAIGCLFFSCLEPKAAPTTCMHAHTFHVHVKTVPALQGSSHMGTQ
jgi:hypothetical protein